MDAVQEKLNNASTGGSTAQVLTLLKDNPDLDVNWADDLDQWTALHLASFYGRDEVVKLLLAHPNINVNTLDVSGSTPFSYGCLNGRIPVIQLLLKDPRVDITLADDEGHTPLWWASDSGKHEVIEWLIASGRDLGDLDKKGMHWGDKEYNALELAREMRKTEVVRLLERFLVNPMQTRHEVRVKLGVLDELAAEVFALTVFLCDGLLQLRPNNSPAVTRFFTIVKKLPMELQMILCHRVLGSMKQNILRKDSEAAFLSLARILLLLDSQSE